MGAIAPEIACIVQTHKAFARWERMRHRARTLALISFPDGHRLRRAVDALCGSLDDCRSVADSCLAHIVEKRWPLRAAIINGFCFDSPSEMFALSPDKYWDCPEFSFGAGCGRLKTLDLFGLDSLHALVDGGSRYLEAVRGLLGTLNGNTKDTDNANTIFKKACERLRRRLKTVRICPKALSTVQLCLRQSGLSPDTSSIVMRYLV